MTIASDISRVDLVGDGVNDTFAFTFEIYTKTDILVYVGGILKDVDVHYTVPIAGIANPDGGNVVFTVGNKPADEAIVSIILNLPFTQAIDYVEADKFPAETHERGLDRLVKIAQQLKEELSRTPSLVISSALSGLTIPEAANRAIGWNGDASELTTFPTTPINRANIDSLDDDYSGSLATMVAGIGANKKSVLIDIAGNLTANLEIPDNIHLIWLNGCVWDGAYSLTIKGHLEAGLYQIFGASITVTFGVGAVKEVYPQWWPDGIPDGATDNAAAIQAALDSVETTYVDVALPANYVGSEYVCASEITMTRSHHGIIGVGGLAIISFTGAGNGLYIKGAQTSQVTWNWLLQDLYLGGTTSHTLLRIGDGDTWHGVARRVWFQGGASVEQLVSITNTSALAFRDYFHLFERCVFRGGKRSIVIGADFSSGAEVLATKECNRIKITDSDFYGYTAYGIYMGNGNGHTIKGVHFDSAGAGAIADIYWKSNYHYVEGMFESGADHAVAFLNTSVGGKLICNNVRASYDDLFSVAGVTVDDTYLPVADYLSDMSIELTTSLGQMDITPRRMAHTFYGYHGQDIRICPRTGQDFYVGQYDIATNTVSTFFKLDLSHDQIIKNTTAKEFFITGTGLDDTLALAMTFPSQAVRYVDTIIEVFAGLKDDGAATNYSSIVRYVVSSKAALASTDMTHDLVGGTTEGVGIAGMVFTITLTLPGAVAIDEYSLRVKTISSHSGGVPLTISVS